MLQRYCNRVTMMHRRRHIPAELLEPILLNLPLKSLLRFSAVSTSWKGMILGAEFRRRYRHREMIVLRVNTTSTSTNGDQKALVCPLSSLSTDGATPFNNVEDGVGASCGELRCVEIDDTLCLFNPSTRARRKLPAPTCLPRIGARTVWESSTSVFAYGLGYDSSTDDYKILKIHASLYGKEAELYSLRSDCWRKVKVSSVRKLCSYRRAFWSGTSKPLLITRSAVYVGGTLHWLVFYSGPEEEFFILTFNVSTEEFGKLALPMERLPLPEMYPYTIPGFKNKMEVCLLRGRLSVCMNYGQRFVVWVMEYGEWKRDLEIDYSRIEPLCYSYLRPLYFCNDGRVIKAVTSSTDNRKLFVFDDEEEEEEEGHRGCSSRSFGSDGYDIVGCFTYVESLVSPFP